jgi:hypothetical protein
VVPDGYCLQQAPAFVLRVPTFEWKFAADRLA